MKKKYFFLFFLFVFVTQLYAYQEFKKMKNSSYQEAFFAMGCFWSGESAFQDHETDAKLPGIISLRVGYTGGRSQNPTYEDHEGHQEAVKIVFNPEIISYDQLLNIFWRNIDPFNHEGQFCDIGPSYVPAIFFLNETQKHKIKLSKEKAEKFLGKSIEIAIKEASIFYEAEEYHQNFKVKNPKVYASYRQGCQRDQGLADIWRNFPKGKD